MIARGLVGWWRLDGRLVDESGLNNTWTMGAGSEAYSLGKFGQAFQGAGSRYCDLGNPSELQINSEVGAGVTLSVWVRPSAYALQAILGAGYLQASTGYGIYWRTAGNFAMQVRVGGAVRTSLEPTEGRALNQWYFVTGIARPGVTEIYINGEFQAETSGTLGDTPPTGSWRLASNSTGPGQFFNTGQIQNAMIYNRALAAHEIRQLYALGSPIGIV